MSMTMKQPAEIRRRVEDYDLITGRARFVDDIRLNGRPPILHAVFVRSPYAHAVIEGIRLDEARSLPGVVAAFSAADLTELPPIFAVPVPGVKRPEKQPLAKDRVRYVGEPVAVIVAESLAIATDALDLVEVDYEPLPAVSDPEAALAPDAPLLYPEFGSNVAFEMPLKAGNVEEAFARASHVTRLRLENQRLAPSSLENRACLFDYDPETGQLSAWLSSQAVYQAHQVLAEALGLDHRHVHVHNAMSGGGFGAKTRLGGEELVCAAIAHRLGRPVKWIETRRENLQAQTHGRGQINYVEAAYQDDGRLLALRLRNIADLGAFLLGITALVPIRTPRLVCGAYQLEAVESTVIGVFTNKVPTMAYRGAGRPEATYIIERVIDRIAAELGLDPVEVRRRNMISPESFPYETVTGQRYDSGNYQAAFDRLLELADYEGWRVRQRQRRAPGDPRLLGIGLATFTEISGDEGGQPREAATVRIRPDGTVVVESGVSSTGQGHVTAFTQIASEVLQIAPEHVEVHLNDSRLPAFSIGTFASRVTQMGGSVVLLAAQAVREKVLRLASHALEAAPADLVLQNGRVMVQGAPTRSLTLGELARLAEEQPALLEPEPPDPLTGQPITGLAARRDFAAGPTFSFGAHMAVVEIDTETGEVHPLSYVAVDDAGRILNHTLAEGQLHGGLAQGIGQALYEQVLYDEHGQLISGTLQDYALPLATMLPPFTSDFVESPSPNNPLGAKGIGESGTIGAPPAIVNAVLDALAPLGIKEIDMPLTPEKIWRTLQTARSST
jgi:carbon-monoxide dehydrogenase large subunit